MAIPQIDILSYSRKKIGRISGYDQSVVKFKTDQDLLEWEARAGGSGVGQGLLVGQKTLKDQDGFALKLQNPWDEWFNLTSYYWDGLYANGTTWNDRSYADDSFVVDDSELTQGDKTYRINVYGKSGTGQWNAYA